MVRNTPELRKRGPAYEPLPQSPEHSAAGLRIDAHACASEIDGDGACALALPARRPATPSTRTSTRSELLDDSWASIGRDCLEVCWRLPADIKCL